MQPQTYSIAAQTITLAEQHNKPPQTAHPHTHCNHERPITSTRLDLAAHLTEDSCLQD